nr:hypothetical protein Iba_chr09fCG3030 [Ipomoea batatas]
MALLPLPPIAGQISIAIPSGLDRDAAYVCATNNGGDDQNVVHGLCRGSCSTLLQFCLTLCDYRITPYMRYERSDIVAYWYLCLCSCDGTELLNSAETASLSSVSVLAGKRLAITIYGQSVNLGQEEVCTTLAISLEQGHTTVRVNATTVAGPTSVRGNPSGGWDIGPNI